MKKSIRTSVFFLSLLACACSTANSVETEVSNEVVSIESEPLVEINVPSLSSGPEELVEDQFKAWAESGGVPFRNERYSVQANDGTFATIVTTAELRLSPDVDWTEMEAWTECRNVGGDWQCDNWFDFGLSQGAIVLTQEASMATSTAIAREEEEVFTSIVIEPDAPFEYEAVEDLGDGYVKRTRYIGIPYTVTNNGSKPRQVFARFGFKLECGAEGDTREGYSFSTPGDLSYRDERDYETILVAPGETIMSTDWVSYFNGYSLDSHINSCGSLALVEITVFQPEIDGDNPGIFITEIRPVDGPTMTSPEN